MLLQNQHISIAVIVAFLCHLALRALSLNAARVCSKTEDIAMAYVERLTVLYYAVSGPIQEDSQIFKAMKFDVDH